MSRPSPRTSEYLLKSARPAEEYEIFISSGSDLEDQRDRLTQLANVFNDQARDARVAYRLIPRRWEQAVSRRTHGDGNLEFRYDAETAHLVVVLLHRDLRPGTREELERAMKCSDTQVAVIWMDPPPPTSRKREVLELRTVMNDLREDVRWESTGAPGSAESVDKMVAVLVRTLIHAAHAGSTVGVPYNEAR